jgi:cephalosporin hydroxylase
MVAALAGDAAVQTLTREWFAAVSRHEYSYHFTWLGLPIIQFPQDIVAMQELLWRVKPDLVIETGVARGGSLIFYASMLELIGHGHVVGIDIDIRALNRVAIESHPMFKRITLLEGSSVDEAVVVQVRKMARDKERVLVVLDSNHTHDHVLRELELYSPLVTRDSYLVAFDTVVEFMPSEFSAYRPWKRGDNAYTAVQAFLTRSDRFVVDREIEQRLQITVAPGGYLRCVRD